MKLVMASENLFPLKDKKIIERFGDVLLLYHTDLGTLFEVNEVGKSIWLLCNGRYSIIDIEKEIAKSYQMIERLDEDIRKFIKELSGLGMISLNTSSDLQKNNSVDKYTELNDELKYNRNKKKHKYIPPMLKEVWTEQSAISKVFLVEI